MPVTSGNTGTASCRGVRQSTPDVPSVLLSALTGMRALFAAFQMYYFCYSVVNITLLYTDAKGAALFYCKFFEKYFVFLFQGIFIKIYIMKKIVRWASIWGVSLLSHTVGRKEMLHDDFNSRIKTGSIGIMV